MMRRTIRPPTHVTEASRRRPGSVFSCFSAASQSTRDMKLRWTLRWAAMAYCIAVSLAIPASLVEEIKATEAKKQNAKVKRAPSQGGERPHDLPSFYGSHSPTAIKRGGGLKNPSPEQQLLNEWEQERALSPYQSPGSFQSTLFNGPDSPFIDDKTIAEYEKGFQYGTNKERLDEALQNAVLKSDIFGDPAAINQYRYFGGGAEERRRKRRRRDTRTRLVKRDAGADLTPEEILTLLTLYESERSNHRHRNYNNEQQLPSWTLPEDEPAEDALINTDENWLDAPVYPHAGAQQNGPAVDVGPAYYWMDDKGARQRNSKRFMVAKKRMDPTRELRYLNGPSKTDFYTLSQLLSNQREPDVPLYHRVVL